MRTINEIIIHCSATPEGKDYTVNDIDKWHKQRGFKCIGYHYVVYRDGTYHKGRDISEVGAHCLGHNANSIGICYIGGMDSTNKNPKDTRTEAQKKTLITLIRTFKAKYPNIKVYGHRDFANKACPSFDATSEYKNI
jgi:N-acetylmuramoyl-L-alanine amidase